MTRLLTPCCGVPWCGRSVPCMCEWRAFLAWLEAGGDARDWHPSCWLGERPRVAESPRTEQLGLAL